MPKLNKGLLFLSTIFLLGSIFVLKVEAKTDEITKTATISANPSTGNYAKDTNFDIQIVVNGGGQQFTTFGATVSVSNLSIVNFSKGSSVVNCTTEPTTSSLSFFCGVAGQTGNVTVYTLTVKSTSVGTASINISGGSVIHTDGYTTTEIFLSAVSGSFNITAPVSTPTPTPTKTVQVTPTPTPTPTCEPSCTDKMCGDDSCGGVCGTCLSGFSCSSQSLCVKNNDFDEDEFSDDWEDLDEDNESNGIEVIYDEDGLIIGNDNNSLSNFQITGQTTPNSLVTIYIMSDTFVQSTYSDDNGDWSILVDEFITSGNHNMYIVTTVNGQEYRNSRVLGLAVDAEAKKVVLGELAPKVTPSGTLTVDPTVEPEDKSNNNIRILLFILFIILIVVTAFVTYYLYKKQQPNKKVTHKKEY